MDRHKNWPVICALPKEEGYYRLKYFIAIEKAPNILAGLQRGWPELFSDEPVPTRVPRSVMSRYGYEYDSQEAPSDNNRNWDSALKFFNLPLAEHFPEAPRDLNDAIGSDSECHLIHWRGRDYILASSYVEKILDENDRDEAAELNLPLPKKGQVICLYRDVILIDPACVDLDA